MTIIKSIIRGLLKTAEKGAVYCGVAVMKLSVQVQCLLDNMAMELETCTNSLVWLMSNKTVNKTVYTFLSECTRKRFIFLHTGENELFISDKI